VDEQTATKQARSNAANQRNEAAVLPEMPHDRLRSMTALCSEPEHNSSR
jgi:hypothetical protein